VDPEGLAPSIFDIIFPDTLNSGEEEALAKMQEQIKRWQYKNGKIKPIDPKTGKPHTPKYKFYTGVPDNWDPPKSPAQKPPASGTPKTLKQKIIRGIEIMLRIFGHWK
jgi:hypothetical protein